MDLYFIRHAESIGNATGDYSTKLHDNLSPKGKKQAEELAVNLADTRFDRILVSPAGRTMQTISPYLMRTSQRGILVYELFEACWQKDKNTFADGYRRGAPVDIPQNQAQMFTRKSVLDAVYPSEDETYGEGLRRVDYIYNLITGMSEKDSSVLIVSHGFFGNHLLRRLLGITSDVFIDHDNCAVTKLSISGKSVNVGYINRLF